MVEFRRVRIAAWSFQHRRGDTIEYSVETHRMGLELRGKMNAELLHSQVFPDREELVKYTDRGRNRLEAQGWSLRERH